MEAILCSIPDTAKALGLGRSKVYKLIKDGQLDTARIGRRRLVLASSIRELADHSRVSGPPLWSPGS